MPPKVKCRFCAACAIDEVGGLECLEFGHKITNPAAKRLRICDKWTLSGNEEVPDIFAEAQYKQYSEHHKRVPSYQTSIFDEVSK